jgi:hypothetical protein
MGTELVGQTAVAALGEQVQVLLAEPGAIEGVVGPQDLEAVTGQGAYEAVAGQGAYEAVAGL